METISPGLRKPEKCGGAAKLSFSDLQGRAGGLGGAHRGRGKGGKVLPPESGFPGYGLLTQRGIKPVDFPHGTVVCRINGDNVDSIGIVFDPIQDGLS